MFCFPLLNLKTFLSKFYNILDIIKCEKSFVQVFAGNISCGFVLWTFDWFKAHQIYLLWCYFSVCLYVYNRYFLSSMLLIIFGSPYLRAVVSELLYTRKITPKNKKKSLIHKDVKITRYWCMHQWIWPFYSFIIYMYIYSGLICKMFRW